MSLFFCKNLDFFDKIFYLGEKLSFKNRETLTYFFFLDYVLISYSLKKIKLLSILLIYLIRPMDPLFAFEPRDYYVIEMLVKHCYRDLSSCNKALYKINNYQKNAAINQKFSCQTRLLGLEANLVMAMNFNFKRNEAKSIIDDLKKYC